MSWLFAAEKGMCDTYYENENDTPFPFAEHKSTDPERGMCSLFRRALNARLRERTRSMAPPLWLSRSSYLSR